MNNKKIAVFGGKINDKLTALKVAADRLGIDLDIFTYSEVKFETENGGKIVFGGHCIDEYGVVFFRSTKNFWEEVSLIVDSIKDESTVVVDPLVKRGRPSDACKAHQMNLLSRAGIPVPKTIYGNYDYLMSEGYKNFQFPMILKGSRGDRRTQVFKEFNHKSMVEKTASLKEHEKKGENKYMLQEYIVNTEDYRIMVLGDRVLGVMKRSVGENTRLKNVFNKSDLPEEVKSLAIRATKLCGLMIGGADVVFRDGDFSKPLFYEVNKTPSYERFMETTGIDVPAEIVGYLNSLIK